MKLVYICSPYSGNIEENTKKTQEYCREAVKEYCTPIAPHLLYPQILDESMPEEREAGLQMGLDLLNVCDEIWIFGNEITAGMEKEMERARVLGVKVVRKYVSAEEMQIACGVC